MKLISCQNLYECQIPSKQIFQPLSIKKIPHIRHLQLSYSLLHHCLAVKRSKGERVNPLGHLSLTVDHMYYASLETRYNSRKIRCIMFYL